MSIDLFGYELPVECRTILARLLNDIHFTSDSGYNYILKTSSYEDIKKEYQMFGSFVSFQCRCFDVFYNMERFIFYHCKSDLLDRLMKENICVTVEDFKVVESTIGNKCLDRV